MTTSTPVVPSVMPQIVTEQRGDSVVIHDGPARSCQLTMMIVFTIFWNIVSCPFLLIAVAPMRNAGVLGWFVLLPLLFTVIGIGLIIYVIRQIVIMHMFGNATLALPQLPLRLGESVSVRFQRSNRYNREIRAIHAKLICQEWVRYTVGTDTRTDSHLLWEMSLPDAPRMLDNREIDAAWTLQIPRDQPPAFSSFNNAIEWKLIVSVDASFAPNTSTAFQLPILPEVLP